MKIDFNFILDNQDGYEPRVGAEYEIAPGKWVKMKPPTKAVQDRFEAWAEDDEDHGDRAYLTEAFEGEVPPEDELITGVAAIAVFDFFTLLAKINGVVSNSVQRLIQSASEDSTTPQSE